MSSFNLVEPENVHEVPFGSRPEPETNQSPQRKCSTEGKFPQPRFISSKLFLFCLCSFFPHVVVFLLVCKCFFFWLACPQEHFSDEQRFPEPHVTPLPTLPSEPLSTLLDQGWQIIYGSSSKFRIPFVFARMVLFRPRCTTNFFRTKQ